MKRIIRLTESDLHNLIQRSVERILREQDDNLLLQSIAQGLVQQQLSASPGENEAEVKLGGDTLAYVKYSVLCSPYMRQGMRSNSYDVPDDPDEIIDNPEVEVIEIDYCQDGDCTPILRSIITIMTFQVKRIISLMKILTMNNNVIKIYKKLWHVDVVKTKEIVLLQTR